MEQRLPILIVEDDDRLMTVLGMLLEFECFGFLSVADGQEALDWSASIRPALVILDWRLPKIGGDRVLSDIRVRFGSQVPVLVLSAIADAEEARSAGANAYLRKPCAVDSLVNVIHRLPAA